jgi:hypothetical protein
MAWIVGDSFDFYTSPADGQGLWDVAPTSGSALGTGRFSGSRAITITNGTVSFVKNSGSNDATHHLAFAHMLPSLSGTNTLMFFTLGDGATNQCTLAIKGDGSIVLLSGGSGGSVLATFTSAFIVATWNYFEVEITINNTTGAIHIRRDGSSTDTFVATGLNTRPGTNAYANRLTISTLTGVNDWIDDLLWFSTAGAAPNTWVGDVRAVQLMPTADTAQKQFAPFPVSYTAQNSNNTASSQVCAANTARWMQVTAPATGAITSLICNLVSSATGNVRMAIYDNTGAGGGPGTLLSVSSAVVNPGAGLITFPVSGGALVVKSTVYYVGVLSDVSLTIYGIASGGTTQWSIAATYGTGFPSTAFGFTVTGFVNGFTTVGMIVTASNSSLVNEVQEDGDTTYVFDNAIGHNDLYDIADLASTPQTIVAVQTRGFVRKNDAGFRAAQVQVKSGGTTVTSTALILSTSYQHTSRIDTVDPNTSAAWSATAVNALQVGPVMQA